MADIRERSKRAQKQTFCAAPKMGLFDHLGGREQFVGVVLAQGYSG
jgi:hypothetical protein